MSSEPIPVSGCRYEKPVGKRIEREADGTLVKKPLLDERKRAGKCLNLSFDTVEEVFNHRLNADARTMFFTGTFEPGLTGASVVVKDAVADAAGPVVAASKEFLEFHEGPGLLSIDIDYKTREELAAVYPDKEPFRFETHDEVEAAINELLPEAKGCWLLIRASASSMIVDAASGEVVKGPGGWRVYMVVDDAREIPRILNTLHSRCWARGRFNYAFLSKGGAVLCRSLADLALARPTQPDYPCADLGPGLKRAPGADLVLDGDDQMLVASSVTLSDDEAELARAKMAVANAALAPAKAKVVGRLVREHTAVLVARGVPKAVAERAAAKRFEDGVLVGSDVVTFEDGEQVSVGVLLSDEGEKYDARVCFDPVEPDYDGGRPVGKFYRNGGVRPVIHSFAHGDKTYKLRYDNETAEAAMTVAKDHSETLIRIMALADLDPVDLALREKQAAKALCLGSAREPLRAGVAKFRAQAVGPDEGQDAAPRGAVLPPPSDPFQVAVQYAAASCTQDGARTLRRWRGSWWEWKLSHWAEIGHEELDKRLYEFTENAFYNVPGKEPLPWMPDRHKIDKLRHGLAAVLRLPDDVEAPFWTDGSEPGSTLVACANGLLDARTRALMPHSPHYFNTVHTPILYDPAATCPTYDNFTRSVWPDDGETPRTVRQMFGYLLSGRTDLQAVFGLIGAKRGGKGTIAWIAETLLGSAVALTQADLGETFGMEHLIGEPLAIIGDTRTAGKNTQTVVERLLGMSGEDSVSVARKFKPAWRGRLSARIMWLSNELPLFGDASTALAHRFILMMFSVSFTGRENRDLKNQLAAEMPGILNVALDGLTDLEKEGRFTQSASALDAVGTVAEMSSPMHLFGDEMCETGPCFRADKEKLYQRHQRWLIDKGFAPVDMNVFSRNLYAAFPHVSQARPTVDGERLRCFTGIKLLDKYLTSDKDRAWSRGLDVVSTRPDEAAEPSIKAIVEGAKVTGGGG